MEALGGLAENVDAPDSAWLRSFWESWDRMAITRRGFFLLGSGFRGSGFWGSGFRGFTYRV